MTQHFDYQPPWCLGNNQSVGHQYQWLAGGYDLEIWHGGYLMDSGLLVQ